MVLWLKACHHARCSHARCSRLVPVKQVRLQVLLRCVLGLPQVLLFNADNVVHIVSVENEGADRLDGVILIIRVSAADGPPCE